MSRYCLLVGCGPTATHFLCFAKESKQRKATTLPLAFCYPIVQGKKWESFETPLWLKQRSFLYPFSVLHNWQCQKWNGVKVKSKTNSIDHHGVQLGSKIVMSSLRRRGSSDVRLLSRWIPAYAGMTIHSVGHRKKGHIIYRL